MSVDSSLFVRQSRLAADYRAMQRLSGPMITWEALQPYDIAHNIYPSKYRITFNIVAPTTSGNANRHVLLVDCSGVKYPFAPPDVRFETSPLRHPHIFNDKRVCLGGFPVEETLAELCLRLVRFFQYDPNMINIKSIASQEFYDWYIQHRASLPLDRQALPSLDEQRPLFRPKDRRGQP